ncbi:hypothetical protein BJV78DRAFT_1300705 [Lactifluus subvellereus]|nr:hypothetical protein BJV78DRAFT_1300705 [Lactifluus subvellereus]
MIDSETIRAAGHTIERAAAQDSDGAQGGSHASDENRLGLSDELTSASIERVARCGSLVFADPREEKTAQGLKTVGVNPQKDIIGPPKSASANHSGMMDRSDKWLSITSQGNRVSTGSEVESVAGPTLRWRQQPNVVMLLGQNDIVKYWEDSDKVYTRAKP